MRGFVLIILFTFLALVALVILVKIPAKQVSTMQLLMNSRRISTIILSGCPIALPHVHNGLRFMVARGVNAALYFKQQPAKLACVFVFFSGAALIAHWKKISENILLSSSYAYYDCIIFSFNDTEIAIHVSAFFRVLLTLLQQTLPTVVASIKPFFVNYINTRTLGKNMLVNFAVEIKNQWEENSQCEGFR